MKERIAIIDGVRTPFCKMSGAFRYIEADDLGAYAVKELVARTGIPVDEIDELVFGNVLQPPQATNIARVLAVKGGLALKTPAMTVNRNCASGMEAIVAGCNRLLLDQADVIMAGGTESMSHFPVLFPDKTRDFLQKISKARTFKQKLSALFSFRFSLLKPDLPGIADPICGLNMGQTAEILSREFHVTREEQDLFALRSQTRTVNAIKQGYLAEEIVPIPLPPKYETVQYDDDGPREGQTIDALAKLSPHFDKLAGSVTAGNSSQVTDGAAAVLLMRESTAKERGYKPLGYVRAYTYAALEPSRMGLGPAFAIAKILDKTGMSLKDFQLFEINEAFAAQVLAVQKACASDAFAKKELNRDSAVGEIDPEILNVNGGAVALGHPVGASGTRIVLTLLKELNRRNQNVGLATLCVGGGQGEAIIVEVQ